MNASQKTRNTKQPRYLQLVEELRRQIETGVLEVGQKLPTYAELEAQLGLSQSTVDKSYDLLLQDGLIYKTPRQGVFVASRTKVRPKTGFIGYADDKFQQTKNFLYFRQLMEGMRAAADKAGKQLVLITSLDNFQRWDQLEGVLFCEAGHHPSFSSEAILPYMPEGMPAVNLMMSLKGMTNVCADDAGGIRQSIEHLLDLGHRRIGYLSQAHYPPMVDHPLVRVRYASYQATLEAHGIMAASNWVYSPLIDEYPDYSYYGYEGMKLWLQNGWAELQCTALMAQNDLCAFGAIAALREAGYDVPGEVSVMGFDGADPFYATSSRLSTVELPLHEIGVAGMEVLLKYIEEPGQKPDDIFFPVKLVVGDTTAPAATSLNRMAMQL